MNGEPEQQYWETEGRQRGERSCWLAYSLWMELDSVGHGHIPASVRPGYGPYWTLSHQDRDGDEPSTCMQVMNEWMVDSTME
jgi:hypothetical protein